MFLNTEADYYNRKENILQRYRFILRQCQLNLDNIPDNSKLTQAREKLGNALRLRDASNDTTMSFFELRIPVAGQIIQYWQKLMTIDSKSGELLRRVEDLKTIVNDLTSLIQVIDRGITEFFQWLKENPAVRSLLKHNIGLFRSERRELYHTRKISAEQCLEIYKNFSEDNKVMVFIARIYKTDSVLREEVHEELKKLIPIEAEKLKQWCLPWLDVVDGKLDIQEARQKGINFLEQGNSYEAEKEMRSSPMERVFP